MQNIEWSRIQRRFRHWWNGTLTGRPLMRVIAEKEHSAGHAAQPFPKRAVKDIYLDVEGNIRRFEAWCDGHAFLGDSFPAFSFDLGPGSMALYLGSEPEFMEDTVWYKPCVRDWKEFPELSYNPDNPWWHKHLEMAREAQRISGGRYWVNIPDIIENLDILASLRGTEALLYDLMDEPDEVQKRLLQIDSLYFLYYDAMYDILKGTDGSNCFTAFNIWGDGKTAKIQCDFSALISPAQFRNLVLPSLRKQTEQLDHSLYHLDGPDAIRHVDALMELEDLDALQWTCGAGQPDGGYEGWYGIYDKVRGVGKSLWVQLYDGGVGDWIASCDRLVDRYGSAALYFLYPGMTEKDAEILLMHADKYWV